eukprot:2016013-Lingulodinium_polyedra.AAC.1
MKEECSSERARRFIPNAKSELFSSNEFKRELGRRWRALTVEEKLLWQCKAQAKQASQQSLATPPREIRARPQADDLADPVGAIVPSYPPRELRVLTGKCESSTDNQITAVISEDDAKEVLHHIPMKTLCERWCSVYNKP